MNNAALQTSALIYLAMAERNLGNYTESLENYHTALDMAEENGYNGYTGSAASNLGNIYMEKVQHDKALLYYGKAISAFTKIDNKAQLAVPLLNAGIVWQEGLENEDSARYYYQKALTCSRQTGNHFVTRAALSLLSQQAVKAEDWQRAISLSRQAVEMAKIIGEKDGLIGSYAVLAVSLAHAS